MIVGREAELATLEATLAGAAAGTPALVILVGEAGIGKTRLVQELSRHTNNVGGRVLIGNCLDLGEGRIPFAPLAQALRVPGRTNRSDLDRLLGPLRSELSQLIPDAARGDQADSRAESAGQAGRARLFEAVLGAFELLGRDAPLLVVFEDIHWIDDATRDLITFLVRNLTHERVLIVLTYRTPVRPDVDVLADYLAELRRSPRLQYVHLRPLRSAETRSLIDALAGEQPIDDRAAQWVERMAEGNPWFIEELVIARREGGPAVPETLRQIIFGPVGQVSEAARAIVDVVALAARPLDEDTIAAATGIEVRLLPVHLRELLAVRILVLAGRAYGLRHALLRDAVLSDLLPVEARRIHRRLAESLADRPSAQRSIAAEIAGHWLAADRPGEAIHAFVEAAAAAQSVYAFSDALRHYENVLDLWGRVPTDQRPQIGYVEVLRRAAEVANLSGDIEIARRLVHDAIDACDSSDLVTLALLHGRLGFLQWLAGENEAAIASHREAVRLLPDDPPSAERARVLGGLAGALMGAGQYRESASVAQEEILVAEATGSDRGIAHGLNILGSDLVSLGETTAGLQHLERAFELARTDAIDARIVAYHNLAFALEQSDRLERGVELATEAIQLAGESGLERRFGSVLRALAGECHFRLGRWDEADRVTRDGLALGVGAYQMLFLLGVRVELLVHRGELIEARELLSHAADVTPGEVDPDLYAFIAARQAELALEERQWTDARDAVARGLEVLGASGMVTLRAHLHALGIRIEADRFRDATIRRDHATAESAAQHAERMHHALVSASRDSPAPSPSADAWLAMSHAEMSTFAADSGPEQWALVAEAWDAIPTPHLAAYARFHEAHVRLRERSGREQAVAALHKAHEVAQVLGALPLQQAIEGEARRARIELSPPPSRPTRPHPGTQSDTNASAQELAKLYGLSAREIEVLGHVAQGRTNGQIASGLFISPKTASVHVTHILTKLGVSNRVEAAMVAARSGLVNGQRTSHLQD